jgi:Caspase domain
LKRYLSTLFCIIALAIISVRADAQQTPRGYALLIGNAAYADKPLKNPLNDATDLGETLKRAGFNVTVKTNLNDAEMKAALADFEDELRKSKAIGLFYFSGHGVQTVAGKNYLLPIGRTYVQERDVELYAIQAKTVLDRMEGVGNTLNIVILDACRDSPLQATIRGGAKGLARMDAPSGSLIAFATAAGKTASDNPTGRNGLYTKHLIKAIQTPNLRLEDVFKTVGREVEKESSRAQSPEEFTKLRDTTPFYFFGGNGVNLEPQQIATADPALEQARWWARIKDSSDPEDFKDFLNIYQTGPLASQARAELRRLERSTNVPRPPAPISNAAVLSGVTALPGVKDLTNTSVVVDAFLDVNGTKEKVETFSLTGKCRLEIVHPQGLGWGVGYELQSERGSPIARSLGGNGNPARTNHELSTGTYKFKLFARNNAGQYSASLKSSCSATSPTSNGATSDLTNAALSIDVFLEVNGLKEKVENFMLKGKCRLEITHPEKLGWGVGFELMSDRGTLIARSLGGNGNPKTTYHDLPTGAYKYRLFARSDAGQYAARLQASCQ